MSDLSLKERQETATEPPKRWRNWWRSVGLSQRMRCNICGVSFAALPKATFTFDHCLTFASQAEAEASAAQIDDPEMHSVVLYIGAFPEGERPGGPHG